MTVKQFARKVFAGQWPILLVGLFLVAGFILVAAGYWRRGALVMAIGVAVAAGLRLALPEDRAGLLAVRTRTVDFLTTATVSAAMLYIAWTIDPLGTSRRGTPSRESAATVANRVGPRPWMHARERSGHRGAGAHRDIRQRQPAVARQRRVGGQQLPHPVQRAGPHLLR